MPIWKGTGAVDVIFAGPEKETPIGIVTMWARATRVEFIIVSVALLVLLMCSKPPRSGNAEIGRFQEAKFGSAPKTAPLDPLPSDDSEAATVADVMEPDPLPEPFEEEPLPPTPKVATVDARSCNDLGYRDVMYGEVTVRWVWNGTKFVPHKVCVVKEKDGVNSVWSFDQQEDAVLSELAEEPAPPR